MKRGTRQPGIRERGGPIQTAFSRQNHNCNLLGTNDIRPNPANTESKNKTAFVPLAIPSLAPVRIIRVYPCSSVVQTLDERKNYQTNRFSAVCAVSGVPHRFLVVRWLKRNDDATNVTPATLRNQLRQFLTEIKQQQSCSLHGGSK